MKAGTGHDHHTATITGVSPTTGTRRPQHAATTQVAVAQADWLVKAGRPKKKRQSNGHGNGK